ncbi:hypothetical protein SSS_09522 [Sarcoptes scabiei]|nr:hypothetical protein SSS_09522 [Sarcoptes scabiei]
MNSKIGRKFLKTKTKRILNALNRSRINELFWLKLFTENSIQSSRKFSMKSKSFSSKINIEMNRWQSTRNILMILFILFFFYSLTTVALKRFREIDSNKNGTILFGSAFHSVWNRDRIEFLAKDFDEIFSSVTLKLSDLSETRFVYAMNDEEFVDFLFQNIEKYFD